MDETNNVTPKKENKINKILESIGDSIIDFIKRFDIEILLIAITIIALVLRIVVFNKISGDMNAFLIPWYKMIYEDSSNLGKTIGDYTPAYFYLLGIIKLFRISPTSIWVTYWIKIYSVIADYVLATFAGLIVYRLTNKNKLKASLTYTIILLCPTIFLNSALWGQCDAIYVSFCVASIYFFLRNNQRTSMILYGVAFAFKLQAIFILPVFLIAIFRKNLKFRYLLYVPLVYVLFAIPSCFFADNFFTRFGEILMVYVNQSANSYSQLSLNAGTFYTIFFTNFKSEDYISSFAVLLALGVIGTSLFGVLHSKEELKEKDYIKVFMFFSILVTFILPHMHDRYYYLADALGIIYIILDPKKFYVSILEITNSMIGYMVYLWNVPFINVVPQDGSITDSTKALSFRFGGILALIAIIIIGIDLFKKLYPGDIKNIEEAK